MNTLAKSTQSRVHEAALAQRLNIPYQIKTIQLSNCELNYFMAGEGPLVLLIHGANFGWGVWYPNIPDLAKRFKIIALDLPGAGRSQRIDYSSLSGEDLYAVVEEFITKMDLKNFSVIGCSIGGWIGLKLALNHSEKVRALVIENGVGFADYMSMSDKFLANYSLASFIARVILKPVRSNPRVELFLRSIFANKQIFLQKEFVEYFYETMATSHNLLFISRLTSLAKSLILKNSLSKIVVPTCIIWGAQDKIMPLNKNQPSFELISNVQIFIYSDSAHIPSVESPTRFNTDTTTFLLNVLQ